MPSKRGEESAEESAKKEGGGPIKAAGPAKRTERLPAAVKRPPAKKSAVKRTSPKTTPTKAAAKKTTAKKAPPKNGKSKAQTPLLVRQVYEPKPWYKRIFASTLSTFSAIATTATVVGLVWAVWQWHNTWQPGA